MRKKSATSRPHRVALVASPGVPLFEFSIAVEVFGTDRRDLTPDWYELTIAGVNRPTTRIGNGIAVPTPEGLRALTTADTVIVPACADVHGHAPDALLDALHSAHARGARIAAICSGTFVLAEAGLLAGRRATTHWMHAGELARRYPDAHIDPAVLYVHDDVWTSAGSAAGLDMCLELVRQDLGAALANDVARRIVVPPHRAGGQAQFIPAARAELEPGAADLQTWVRDNLAGATVAGMAKQAGVSPRTLNRRFREQTGVSPQVWLQRVRLETAAVHLETTNSTVQAIARQVGLGTASNLRSRFASAYAVTPGEYRRTFSPSERPLISVDA